MHDSGNKVKDLAPVSGECRERDSGGQFSYHHLQHSPMSQLRLDTIFKLTSAIKQGKDGYNGPETRALDERRSVFLTIKLCEGTRCMS